MKKKITVAIPVYNREKWIPEALQSILAQTIKIDEILICDNQSTDKTIEIIKQIIEKNPKENIRLHQNEVNIGAAPNFNKCLELCETNFLVILGSDDRLKTNAIQQQIELFNKIPNLGLVGGLINIIDQDGKLKSKANAKETIVFHRGDLLEYVEQTRFYLNHSTVMYNMDSTRKLGLIHTKYIGSDERFYIKHLLNYPIAQIGEALAEVRFHDAQATNNENSRFKDKIKHFEANLEIAKLESSSTRIKQTQKILKYWIGYQAIDISYSFWKSSGKKQLALKYWFYGLGKCPDFYFRYYIYWKAKIAVKRILT